MIVVSRDVVDDLFIRGGNKLMVGRGECRASMRAVVSCEPARLEVGRLTGSSIPRCNPMMLIEVSGLYQRRIGKYDVYELR